MPIERSELEERKDSLEADIAAAEGELDAAKEAVSDKEMEVASLQGSLAEVERWLAKLPPRESEDYPKLGQ